MKARRTIMAGSSRARASRRLMAAWNAAQAPITAEPTPQPDLLDQGPQEGHGRAGEAPGGVRGPWRPDAMRMGTARHGASHNPPKGVPHPVRGEDGSQ